MADARKLQCPNAYVGGNKNLIKGKSKFIT